MMKARSLGCWAATIVVSMLLATAPGAQESTDGPVNRRDQVIEEAGVAYGVALGNVIYPGFKVATMILAAPQAGLAWLLSLGDTEQARTILDAHFEGPYYISREQARTAMGTDVDSRPYERELVE